jgi:hypothetical protein
MWKRTKIDPADKYFSEYIRKKANWKCEYCKKDYSDNHQGLHCSHYWSRIHESTRYDPDNCMALCFYHHQILGHGEGRDEYKRIMIKKLGEKGFQQLTIRANQIVKKDRIMSLLIAKQLLKTL